jgi:hypothetical protein
MYLIIKMFNFCQNKSFKAASTSREPPRLVVVGDGSAENPDSGFIFSDGCVIECGSTSVLETFMSLIYCYFAWQLNYPRQCEN